MSFSNAADEATLGRVAGALAVDEAFVEKDWFVVKAIGVLRALDSTDFTPVFSGGTALLKGHALIKRFSEDIDFKLVLSDTFAAKGPHQQRKSLGAYRDALAAAWSDAGFAVTKVASHRANAFIQFEMDYLSRLGGHASLRPHVLAEISARPPRLPPAQRPVSSFVAQYRSEAPEIADIACVDPVETAADKLSAFTWRMLQRDRADERDDPAIVRHLHDLAVLEPLTVGATGFLDLLERTLAEDSERDQGRLDDRDPRERLQAMHAELARDEVYAAEYQRFVGGMAFAGEAEIPSFETALEAIQRLVARFSERS